MAHAELNSPFMKTRRLDLARSTPHRWPSLPNTFVLFMRTRRTQEAYNYIISILPHCYIHVFTCHCYSQWVILAATLALSPHWESLSLLTLTTLIHTHLFQMRNNSYQCQDQRFNTLNSRFNAFLHIETNTQVGTMA